MKLIVSAILALMAVFLFSCSVMNENKLNCNFSSDNSEPERCFYGVGDRCKGIPLIANFKFDNESCIANGYMSIGSILHDKCCIDSGNVGVFCAFSNGSPECIQEWEIAKHDALCTILGYKRQWQVNFGPYKIGNKGDDISKKIYATSGAKIDLKYSTFCKDGCSSLGRDFCGDYCICK